MPSQSITFQKRQIMVLAVSAGMTLVALTHFMGSAVVLLLGGMALLASVVIMQIRPNRGDTPSLFPAIRPIVLLGILGVGLVALGLLIRFSPRDIGMMLAIGGLSTAGIVGLYFLFADPKRQGRSAQEHGSRAAESSTTTSIPADEFRHQVTSVVFSHARLASLLTFGIALALFLAGIGAFILVGYGVYQQTTPSSQADAFQRFIQGYYDYTTRSNTYGPEQLGLVLALQAGRFIPIFGLLLIGWIGSRLIVNASRLSHRRVLQDTLAQLGPLQSTMAGLPPRKPIAEAVEQSLKHARRSFAVRTWLSIVLFAVGVVLFVSLFIFGWKNNFTSDPLMTATVAGSGLISFVLSMIANRQSEVRQTLDQIAGLELQIAEKAQKSEILDLYVAQLVKEGFQADRLQDFNKVYRWLNSELSSGASTEKPPATRQNVAILTPTPKERSEEQAA